MYQWEKRLRLGTGLVLAVYVIQHFINHSLGIVGFEAMEAWRRAWSPVWDNLFFMALLHGSLLTHFLLALMRLYHRRTLRMPPWELGQIVLGLAIAPMIAAHVIGTRVSAELGGFDPDYEYMALVIASNPRQAVQLPLLLIVVWTHVVIGLHFWLRLKRWYRRSFPVWVVFAVALPLLAEAGVLRAALTANAWLDDPEKLEQAIAGYLSMDTGTRAFLSALEAPVLWTMLALLLGVLMARAVHGWVMRRRADVQIAHSSGRTVRAHRGQTMLEALRAANIPHMSVCGGRARCTTCRVRVGVGREQLPAPGALEQAALERIHADATVRLACQTRPEVNVAVTPLVAPGSRTEQALAVGGVQGAERDVVCVFVDMRGSTHLGERILPYDVVFILNQFFRGLSDSLEATDGHYAQFSGDGLMALYGLTSPNLGSAARDAIDGAVEMFRRLESLNTRLEAEFGFELQMGVGVHSGAAIVGSMGPPRSPLLTAIGDNINIAARLESASKQHGCDVIISTETLDLVTENREGLDIRIIDIRGRKQGIEVAMFSKETLSAFAGSTAVTGTRSRGERRTDGPY